ncbi:monoamine oxidase [Flavobacterium sp. 270]|uniref:flavin monoamine oxidase family protein n=1 Tax=Flavobacterium sp. 270 TaxID=2512114 RepID=UPI001065EE63|nr:NAD(P)/FAD-dependent oxidoreductase [Flavobacterium sp. 270]TDW52715.1 monoamine oxidase [Flavobacterium sp. 270]
MRHYSSKTKELIGEVISQKEVRKTVTTRANLHDFSSVVSKSNVVVIGAGIAGLCCAYELEKKGYSVTILEAQKDHIGGRIRTYRKGDTYAEFGAMRIPEGHYLTLQYVNHFELKTREFVQENEEAFAYIRGMRVKRNESGYESLKPLFPLTGQEQLMSKDDFWMKSVIQTLKSLSPLELQLISEDILNDKKLVDLDQNSLYNNLSQSKISKAAMEYVCSVYGVTTYLNTAILEHLREENEGVWINGFKEIEGGMDLLVEKFVSSIKTKISADSIVTKIINSDEYGEVIYINNGEKKSIKADWVICTIPLGVLSRVEIENAFSKEKINAIKNVNYDSSSKIISLCKKRFWEQDDKIFGGGSIWDGGLGHTWYPSDNAIEKNETKSASQTLLLSSYTWGMHARRIDSIPEESINDYVRGELKKIHSDSNMDDVVDSVRWSWDNHEWSSGAFAFFNPGDQTDLHKELVRPEKRVLLAGEHCSLTHSWIQGALESAVNVCIHILKHKI